MFGRGWSHFTCWGLLGLVAALFAPATTAWGQATDLVCNGCVQATDIENGTIGPNKLIPGSINATTIANGVIGPNKLIPGSINTATIANNAIRSNKILDGAVQSVDIADGAVTRTKIAPGGLTSAEVQDSSLTADDLGDEAGVEFVSGDQNLLIAGADNTVRSITLTAPTSGFILANASGEFAIVDSSNGATVGCSITTGTTIDPTHAFVWLTGNRFDRIPFAGTRVFTTSGGSVDIRLVCNELGTTLGDIFARDTSLNALFVPTRY